MPIIHNWDESNPSISVLVFSDPWTWEEYLEAIAERSELLREVKQVIHIVSDMTLSTNPPERGLHYIPRIASIERPYNTGLIIVVDPPNEVRLVANAFSRMYEPVTIVSTYGEIHTRIELWEKSREEQSN